MESPEANENSYEVFELIECASEGREPNLPEPDIVDIPSLHFHIQKCQHYGAKLISLLLNWIRWKRINLAPCSIFLLKKLLTLSLQSLITKE